MVKRSVIFCAWAGACVAVLTVGINGCDDRGEPYVLIEMPELSDTNTFNYDAYFTWKNYGETSKPADAVYIWDGKEVGSGNAGFQSVLSRLRKLPRGSKVLLYPNYGVNRHAFGNMDSGVVVFPFEDDRDLLREVAVQRKLRVIWSPYDHTGRLHPQVREVWYALVEEREAIEERKREKAARKYSGDISEDGKLRMVKLLNLGRTGVTDLAFCAASREVLVCFGDNKAYQWNIDTKNRSGRYVLDLPWKIYRVALSLDGRRGALLAGLSYQGPWQVSVVDTLEGRTIESFQIIGRFSSVKFSNGGQYLLVTSREYEVPDKVYDLSGQRMDGDLRAEFSHEPSRLRANPPEVTKMTPNPGLSLYDANENEILRIEVSHCGGNFGITRDNKYIATVTWDRELIVWRTTDRNEVYRYDLKTSCRLRYDPVKNQFLIANAEDRGSKYMRALRIQD